MRPQKYFSETNLGRILSSGLCFGLVLCFYGYFCITWPALDWLSFFLPNSKEIDFFHFIRAVRERFENQSFALFFIHWFQFYFAQLLKNSVGSKMKMLKVKSFFGFDEKNDFNQNIFLPNHNTIHHFLGLALNESLFFDQKVRSLSKKI